MKQVYRTNDGFIFDTFEEADNHEKKMFDEWLTTVRGEWVKSVLNTMDDKEETEYFGTLRDFGVEFAKAAFRFQQGNHDRV